MANDPDTTSTARKVTAAAAGVAGVAAGAVSLGRDESGPPDSVLALGDDVLGIAPPAPPVTAPVVHTGSRVGDEVTIGRDVEVDAFDQVDAAAPEDVLASIPEATGVDLELGLDDPVGAVDVDASDHDLGGTDETPGFDEPGFDDLL